VSESFEDLANIAPLWQLDAVSCGARVRVDKADGNGFMVLEASNATSQEISVHRPVDLSFLRGQRIRMSARVERARAVILDLRGLIRNEAFELLAHFLAHGIRSPQVRAPVVGPVSTHLSMDLGWTLYPAEPHVAARLIVLVSGRSISADETLAQLVRDNHLGVFVGEPTAGANGNVNTFQVPGGFDIRFTGLKVLGPDGATIQGHGIVPEHMVHPSIDSARVGRDEIYQAALAVAQQPSVAP
jgi:C-terminal processing protease CtpA/Prc